LSAHGVDGGLFSVGAFIIIMLLSSSGRTGGRKGSRSIGTTRVRSAKALRPSSDFHRRAARSQSHHRASSLRHGMNTE
jgi:hypothetical protein